MRPTFSNVAQVKSAECEQREEEVARQERDLEAKCRDFERRKQEFFLTQGRVSMKIKGAPEAQLEDIAAIAENFGFSQVSDIQSHRRHRLMLVEVLVLRPQAAYQAAVFSL
jgi:hypothetical protein